MSGETPGRSFADKLEHLFATVHPRDRRPYSMDVVAAKITEQGGDPVSAGYLWMLRKGQRDNPTIRTVEAIARFFGVPTAYFFDDELAGRVDEQLELLAKMRDAGLESLGLRAGELSPESRAAVARVIDIASEALAKMLGVVANAEAPGDEGPQKS